MTCCPGCFLRRSSRSPARSRAPPPATSPGPPKARPAKLSTATTRSDCGKARSSSTTPTSTSAEGQLTIDQTVELLSLGLFAALFVLLWLGWTRGRAAPRPPLFLLPPPRRPPARGAPLSWG